MDSHNSDQGAASSAIENRADTGGGFWNVGWPLLALALIVLMTVHACVT